MNWKPRFINLFMSCMLVFAVIGIFNFIDFTIKAIMMGNVFNIIIVLFVLSLIYILSLDEVNKDVKRNKRQSKSSKRHR